jgi:hypothetical protein
MATISSSPNEGNQNQNESENQNHHEVIKNNNNGSGECFVRAYLVSDGAGEAVAGFIGGFLSKMVDFPGDTIKSVLQSSGSSAAKINQQQNIHQVGNNTSSFFQSLNYQSNVSCCNATNSQFQHHLQRHQQSNDFRISKNFVYRNHQEHQHNNLNQEGKSFEKKQNVTKTSRHHHHPQLKHNLQNQRHYNHHQHHHHQSNFSNILTSQQIQQQIQQQEQHQIMENASSSSASSSKLTARSCIRQIYRQYGLRGFYSGIASPLFGNALVKSIRFTIYGRVQNSFTLFYENYSNNKNNNNNVLVGGQEQQTENKNNNKNKPVLLPLSLVAIAGGIAGGGCCAVLTPLEVTKIRCQVNPHLYPGVLSCVYQTLCPPPHPTNSSSLFSSSSSTSSSASMNSLQSGKHCSTFALSNIKNLYSGFTATFVKESIGYAFWFYVYEKTTRSILSSLNNQNNSSSASFNSRIQFSFINSSSSSKQENEKQQEYTRDNLPYYASILAGAASSFCFWTVFYPIDSVKTIQQTTSPFKKMVYDPLTGRRTLQNLNFIETATEIWMRDPKIFYRGLGITLLRSVPSNAVTMFFYEVTLKIWREQVQKKTKK